MSREPSAVSLVAEGFARIADVAGLVLLSWLGYRMFFVSAAPPASATLAVGILGTAACWANRAALKNAPAFLLAYVGIAMFSSAVHRWGTVSVAPQPEWLSLFSPASHLALMAVFVYGAAALLRTPWRLCLFVLSLVLSIHVVAALIVFDRATVVSYTRAGTASIPSVHYWSGIHGLSLLLTLGLPLVLSMALVSRSLVRTCAGVVLAAGLLVVGYLNGSRGGMASMVLVTASMAAFGVVERVPRSWRRPALVGVVTVMTAGITLGIVAIRAYGGDLATLNGRTTIWAVTARLIWDHPWLGVGPGNYALQVNQPAYAREDFAVFGTVQNAHNLLVHVTAETGVVGGLALLALLGSNIAWCWRAWVAGQVPMVSVGLLFATIGLSLHSFTEDFLDARADVERTRLFVWMFFAASLALHRLSQAPDVNDEAKLNA